MLQDFKKLKLYTKSVQRRYMKQFTSKFICNNLYLLFVNFIIHSQSLDKYFLQLEHHIEWRWEGKKLKIGVTLEGKSPNLVYMIYLIYCFHFFSVIATLLFAGASCIFKLKELIPSYPFGSLNCYQIGAPSHIWKL